MLSLYHNYRHLSRGILNKICTNRGNFLRSSFPYLATRLAASPWRMLKLPNCQRSVRDLCERPSSSGAYLAASHTPIIQYIVHLSRGSALFSESFLELL